jgi:signal peptidase II
VKIRQISFWVVLVDQVSKRLVVHYCQQGQSLVVFKNILSITYIDNRGAAFGFMANIAPWIRLPFFVFITIAAGLVVYSYQRLLPSEKIWQRFPLGLIWGGAMGNFIDRVIFHQVVDFIDVSNIPFWKYHFLYIFNVADSCITVGLAFLFIVWFFGKSDQSEGIA